MGDIWNPFDDKNPVYKKLAKETSIQSKRIRNTVVVVGLLAAGYITRLSLVARQINLE